MHARNLGRGPRCVTTRAATTPPPTSGPQAKDATSEVAARAVRNEYRDLGKPLQTYAATPTAPDFVSSPSDAVCIPRSCHVWLTSPDCQVKSTPQGRERALVTAKYSRNVGEGIGQEPSDFVL